METVPSSRLHMNRCAHPASFRNAACARPPWWEAVVLLVLVAGVAGTSGCGPIPSLVTGTVTINGQPAPAGLLLEFQPRAAGSSPSLGRTDAAGRYELWKTGREQGISPGPCVVRISVAPASADRGPPKLSSELERLSIPEKYGTASTLSYDIAPGRQTINIDIAL